LTDRRRFLHRSALAAGALVLPEPGWPLTNAIPDGPPLPLVSNVDPHRLLAQVRRVLAAAESLHYLLATLPEAKQAEATAETIQRALDPYGLVGVHINPEMRVKIARGPARPSLVERGWRTFLVKVHNEAGTTAALRATSTQAHRWLDLLMFDGPPLSRTLSGLELEYRLVRLYSHDAGQREASLAFDVGQGSQDLGFRNEVPILFDC
jgi:hypothetical protein